MAYEGRKKKCRPDQVPKRILNRNAFVVKEQYRTYGYGYVRGSIRHNKGKKVLYTVHELSRTLLVFDYEVGKWFSSLPCEKIIAEKAKLELLGQSTVSGKDIEAAKLCPCNSGQEVEHVDHRNVTMIGSYGYFRVVKGKLSGKPPHLVDHTRQINRNIK